MSRIGLFAVVALTLVVGGTSLRLAVSAQTAGELRGDPEAIARAVIECIQKGDTIGVVEVLGPHSAWTEEQRRGFMQRLTEDHGKAIQAFGPPLNSVEVLPFEVIGDTFFRSVVLEKLQGHVIVWRITFYRSGENWRLVGLSWDNNIEPLFRPIGS